MNRSTPSISSAERTVLPRQAGSRMKALRNALLAGAALSICSFSPAYSQSASYFWTDATGDGDWFATENWNPGLPTNVVNTIHSAISNGNAVIRQAGARTGGNLEIARGFLAEKVLGNIVASGVKILVLAVIVGIGSGLFSEFTTGFSDQPTVTEALSVMLAALALMGLSIFGPGIATGLVSGAPQLGAGAAVGTGLAAAGIGAAGFMGARAATGGAIGAVGAGGRMSAAAARGGAHLAGSASAAYGLGASTSGQTGMGAVAAGLGGVGRAGASAAAAPVKRAMSRAAESMRSSYRSGQAGAWAATGGGNDIGVAAAGASGTASSSTPPAWAGRMKRGSANHGASVAAHTIRAGDSGGGSMSVNLNQDDRR